MKQDRSHKGKHYYDDTMSTQAGAGRVNQKRRTREAILAASRELIRSGSELSMPEVARAALVSEATAYRYFPDLPSLVHEALLGMSPDPVEALAHLDASTDPVERVASATEVLMRDVLSHEGTARAAIAASITRPELARNRPGFRFGLIDAALAPLVDAQPTIGEAELTQLKRDLSMIISAESLFTLTDVCGLSPEEAIATAIHAARVVTSVATGTA